MFYIINTQHKGDNMAKRKQPHFTETAVREAAWLGLSQVRVTTNVHRPARTQTVTEKIGGSINVRLNDGFALLGGE